MSKAGPLKSPTKGCLMSNYAYVAVDQNGSEMRGMLDVADQSEALKRIKEMGLFPTRVF